MCSIHVCLHNYCVILLSEVIFSATSFFLPWSLIVIQTRQIPLFPVDTSYLLWAYSEPPGEADLVFQKKRQMAWEQTWAHNRICRGSYKSELKGAVITHDVEKYSYISFYHTGTLILKRKQLLLRFIGRLTSSYSCILPNQPQNQSVAVSNQ